MIEINSSIPVGIHQTHRSGAVLGSSFTSTVQLGRGKGYVPVCHTGNLIFVRADLIDRMEMPEEELAHEELLFDYNWLKLNYESPIPLALRRWDSLLQRVMRGPKFRA